MVPDAFSSTKINMWLQLLQNQCPMVFVCLLTVMSVAAELPAQGDTPAVKRDELVTVLTGSINDENGMPLENVRVKVAVPATDMRFANSEANHLLGSTTDKDGNYRVEIPDVSEAIMISVDAMKQGFRRRSGMLMRWDGETKVQVEPEKTTEADMTLKPSGYFAGLVVDETGKPIAGVSIGANASGDTFSAGIERTSTDHNGRFEIFNYPKTRADLGDEFTSCKMYFNHDDYVQEETQDVFTIDDVDRTDLRIVMPRGYHITGTILNVLGKPFAGAMVKVVSTNGGHRKGVITNSEGKFALKGVAGGEVELSCIDRQSNQKRKLSLNLNADKLEFDMRLLPISVSSQIEIYEVLGMKLTDVTPELKAAYEFWSDEGAMIVDPGTDHARLEIGELAKGDYFWLAGKEKIANVQEFVAKVIEEAEDPKSELSVRVVYSFSRPTMDGNNTQYLKLTPADVEQLRTVLEQANDSDKQE